MIKTIIKKSSVPVYRTRLWIVVTTNLPKAIDELEDQLDHKIAGAEHRNSIRAYTYGFVDQDGRAQVIIFIRPNSSPGEIAHETKHAVNIIFQWHGVKLSTTNDESECYYLERLINKVHCAILSHKKQFPRKVN